MNTNPPMTRSSLIVFFRASSLKTEMLDYRKMMNNAADDLQRQVDEDLAAGRREKLTCPHPAGPAYFSGAPAAWAP